MRIIVGLGNPGEQYEKTRHNVGFLAIDHLINKIGGAWQLSKKFNSYIVKDAKTIYLKPLTYMNNSGKAVEAVMSYYKLLPKKIGFIKQKGSDLSEILTIIHDDKDIDFGKIKNSTNSRSAGHNGVQSIINYLKTKNFNRVRIGVKTGLADKIPSKKFVLQRFTKEEQSQIQDIIKTIDI